MREDLANVHRQRSQTNPPAGQPALPVRKSSYGDAAHGPVQGSISGLRASRKLNALVSNVQEDCLPQSKSYPERVDPIARDALLYRSPMG